LGILAQLQGDYPEAEHRYRQALTINEQLGNRAGIATTYSALGDFALERSQLTDAVQLHIQSLLLRAQMHVPEVSNNLHSLRRLREQMGQDHFLARVSELLAAEDTQQLESWLDSLTDE
uniref:tetratricopeptide repeat protein n=1 Tax=Nocardia lijiangensis TaxID=299618 RepID=UPI000A739FA7